MKTYYELLGLPQAAPPDEIKRAFRREIARYHPDKVQHLGPEFQEIASARAAELTEAYRVLMDVETRRHYDEELGEERPLRPVEDAVPPRPATAPPPPEPPAAPEPPPIAPRVTKEQASTTDFVRRAVLARLRDAIGAVGGSPTNQRGFDAVFQVKGRRGLFRKPEADVRVAARVVSLVDAEAIQEAWTAASRMTPADEVTCLMLLGSGMAPVRDLAAAVSELRRKARRGGPLVIPVDVRDWEALVPPETPPSVRGLLDRLRQGE